MRTPEIGATRAVTNFAGDTGRRATLRAAAVVAGTGAAAALAAAGSPGRAGVALVGGATLGGLPAAPDRLARRWPLAVGVLAAVVVGVAVAGDDPGPGLTLVGALAGGLAALAVAGLAGVRWWTWTGVWSLAAAAAVTALLVVPGGAAVHRLAVVALAVALLVAVARGLSKLALRLVAVALAVAALASLAWIGDRAPVAQPTAADRSEARIALRGFADEAEALRAELPCTGRNSRPPDARLCAELTGLAADATRNARHRDVGAVAPLGQALDRLREDVAVRVMPNGVEPEARVAAAERRAAAAGDGGDGAAWAEAARVEPDEPRDVRQLAARGVDQVVADTFEPLVGESTVARLGTAGWVVLAVLLALGYRRLEVINNRRYGGPVSVAEVATAEGAAAGLAPELTAAIRNRVAELELRAPAPVPGADPALKPTADIVAGLGADPAPPAGRLAAAFTAVKHAVVPVPGVRVVPAYAALRRRPADGDAPADRSDGGPDDADGPARTDGAGGGEAAVDHVMAVRLVTPDGRRTLRAASFTRSSAAAAAQAAADFAVCDALGRSSLTPSWARWWSEDGTALAPYQAVVADTGRNGPRLALRRQIELLETVRASSPGTGLALVELGHRYELDERPLDALRSHLTARMLHPRFAQARYRTAASLSMLAAPGRLEEHWLDADHGDARRQVADLLVESGLVERARRTRLWRVVRPRCPTDADEQRAWLAQAEPSPGARRDILKVFLLVAHAELAAMERRLSYPGLLAGACRQSERHVWLQVLAHPARRRAATERYRSARWIAELRLALMPAEPGTDGARHLQQKVDALADRPDAGSTALYNAACFTAVLAERSPAKGDERVELQERAVRYLARAALRGRGPVPSSGWLTTDPDLVAVQAVPAFNELVRRLADDEERHSATTAGTPV